MRRAILAITGTIAGLVALLSFKSHVPSIPSAAASGTGNAPAPAAPRSSQGQGQGQGQGQQFGFPTGALASLPAGERAVTGKVANTAYGPVQIQLAVKGGKIVKISVLQQPTNTVNDIQIGRMAFPRLISETLTAQSAKIDAVSGASYTSQGYIQSLQSAVDRGA
jgi:FMN-binding domain